MLLCSLTAISAGNTTITDDDHEISTNDNHEISTNDYQEVQLSKSINKQNTIKSENKISNSNETSKIIKKENNLKSSSDVGTFNELQEEITKAGVGGRVTLTRDYKATSVNFLGQGAIQIRSPKIINGQGHTLDANNIDRIFNINAQDVWIYNLTLINGDPLAKGSFIYWKGSRGLLENCTFKNVYKNGIQASTYSAIYLKSYNATIKDCVFHNLASKEGSAIYIDDQLDNIINCEFTDNYDEVAAKSQDGILLTKAGGAIYVNDKYTLIKDCYFNNNIAEEGGAIYINSNFVTVETCDFINNKASENGAAIYLNEYNVDIKNNTFALNRIGNGINPTSTIYNNIYSTKTMDADNNWWSNSITNKNVDLTYVNDDITVKDRIYLDIDYPSSAKLNNPVEIRVTLKKDDKTINGNIGRRLHVTASNAQVTPTSFRLNGTKTIKYTPIQDTKGNFTIYVGELSFTKDIEHIPIYSFTELQREINKAKNEYTLTHDYTYTPNIDDDSGIKISTPLKINGNGYTINGLNKSRLINIVSDNVTLENINLINGKWPKASAIYWDGSNGLLKNSNISHNYGGLNSVIYIEKDNVTLLSNTFNNNKAVNEKGIIALNGNDISIINNTIKNSNIKNNQYPVGVPPNKKRDNYLNHCRVYENNSVYQTFTILEQRIKEIPDFYLDDDYTYDPEIDKGLKNGIKITKSIILDGSEHTINGNHAARIFDIESDNVTIKNISLINGKTDSKGGAIYWNGKNGILENSKLENNYAVMGGAVYINKANTKINRNIFNNNTAKNKGGAIHVQSPTSITNNLFTNNNASGYNKAVDFYDKKYLKPFTNNVYINNTQFTFETKIGSFTELQELINSANGTLTLTKGYKYHPIADTSLKDGIKITKAITIDGKKTMTSTGDKQIIDGNKEARIFDITSNNVTLTNVKLINGISDERGGAIIWDASNGKLENSIIENNFAPRGGAIYLKKENNTMTNNNFNYNSAAYGGAIYVSANNTTLENNIFRDNEAKNGPNYAVYTTNQLYVNDINNSYINNYEADYGGNAEDDDENTPSYQENKKTVNNQKTTHKVSNIAKITVKKNNKVIKINDNQLTLATLNNIFGLNFTEGHLAVYIDGKLVFNDTTTDDLSQIIYDLLKLLSGNHEIKVEFTDNEGKTNTYTETITV